MHVMHKYTQDKIYHVIIAIFSRFFKFVFVVPATFCLLLLLLLILCIFRLAIL